MKWLKNLLKKFGAQEDRSISNFTPRAQQVLALARKEADRFNHNYLGTEHLLLGLIKLGQGVAVNVLQRMGVDLETARKEVEKQTGTGPDQKVITCIPYTPRVKKVLDLARREAKNLNHTYIGTEHLFLGLIREGDGIAAQILRNLDVNLERARIEVLKELDPNFIPRDESREKQLLPGEAPSIKNVPKDWFDSAKEYYAGSKPEPGQFTPRTQQVLANARKEAERLYHNFIGTEHVLLGLIKLELGVAANVLISLGLTLEKTRAEVEKFAGIGPVKEISGNIPYTPRTKRILEIAKKEADALNHTFIGTEHLLLGLLSEKEGLAAEVFKNFKMDMEQLRKDLLNELKPPGDDTQKK